MLIELLVMAVFVFVFFRLIRADQRFFENRLRWVQVELGVTLFLSIFLFVSAGFSFLLLFFLFWALVSVASYVIYLKVNPKLGFIGSSFCLYFTLMFVYLELFLLNFNF